jgi:Domain of unknown function (DUF4351)/Putative transposase, YhgA-like
MIDHDRLFKELLTTFFVDFLKLFAPDVVAFLDVDSIEFLDKEIFTDVTAGERYEADVIVKARFRGRDTCFLIHVEHQASKQGDFARRMFVYFARLHEKYGLPIVPIALFSYDAPKTPEPSVYEVALPSGETVVRFTYRTVQLNRLTWRDFLRHENPVAAALMAKMDIAVEDRPRVKLECLRLLATLKLDPARTRLISGFVDTYLRLSPTEETRFETALAELVPQEERKEVMELTTSWMERGIEQGLQQGLQQGLMQGLLRGREEGLQQGLEQGLHQGLEQGLHQGLEQGLHQGEVTVTLRLLKRRFGVLPEAVTTRISALPLARVEALADALLDFATPDDLTRWLDQTE